MSLSFCSFLLFSELFPRIQYYIPVLSYVSPKYFFIYIFTLPFFLYFSPKYLFVYIIPFRFRCPAMFGVSSFDAFLRIYIYLWFRFPSISGLVFLLWNMCSYAYISQFKISIHIWCLLPEIFVCMLISDSLRLHRYLVFPLFLLPSFTPPQVIDLVYICVISVFHQASIDVCLYNSFL